MAQADVLTPAGEVRTRQGTFPNTGSGWGQLRHAAIRRLTRLLTNTSTSQAEPITSTAHLGAPLTAETRSTKSRPYSAIFSQAHSRAAGSKSDPSRLRATKYRAASPIHMAQMRKKSVKARAMDHDIGGLRWSLNGDR
jgi:hypothetical protein